jgi:hypothetical protein
MYYKSMVIGTARVSFTGGIHNTQRVIGTAIMKNPNAIALRNLIAHSTQSSRWITYL